ncbi:hypothetical protein EKH55_2454 [Sinorhizobium alkalisoli]|nr:hypothetical protein EKH55_2454 [Sinorhizobium alkalisoli]
MCGIRRVGHGRRPPLVLLSRGSPLGVAILAPARQERSDLTACLLKSSSI